jgi:septal ring factor EnvC (AmiA/AmiB activator)
MDVKTMLIIALLAVLSFFYFKPMFSGDDNLDERETLEKANKELIAERKVLEDAYILKQEDFEKDSTENVKLKKELKLLEALLANKDEQIKKAKEELDKAREVAEITRKQIEELEENPIKRTGQDLLNSINEKTTK